MTSSAEVTWLLDGITMHGTLARPDGEGPFLTVAGIVLAAPPGRSVGEVLLPQLALQAACTNAGAASARSV